MRTQSPHNPPELVTVTSSMKILRGSVTVTIRGQLAVGLAFAFAGILAMFGLVYNSSLNTHEKMKMQTASDYAALKVSVVQSSELNQIRNLNQSIETMWEATNVALTPPFCMATGLLNPGFDATITVGKLNAVSHSSGVDCVTACKDYDQFMRDKIIESYSVSRDAVAQAIITTIQKTNQVAYDNARDTFFYPSNLPNGLFVELQHTLGNGFTLSSVENAYDHGQLTEGPDYTYQVLDESASDPLFIPKNEQRLFNYPVYGYYTFPQTTYNVAYCTMAGIISDKTSLSNARITRDGDYTTQFFTGIKYVPPLNIIQKMVKVALRQPDSKDPKFGENIEGDIPLFSKPAKENRTATTVMSDAKPYGGSFPRDAFIADITGLSGSSGDEFKGAKLFGIADKDEVGGVRVQRADSCLPEKDEFGNDLGCNPFYAEDFLH